VSAADGTIAARYEYGPFGELLRATGPMAKANPFLFSTKYYDWEAGLYYYGYRYYSASTGRWLSRDPIMEKGGHNIYAFVGNDPRAVDPLGLMRWHEVQAMAKDFDARLAGVKCCCGDDFATGLEATLKGAASGTKITYNVQIKARGCATTPVDYYWWDCATAQHEYDQYPSPNKPKGNTAWQDYGWQKAGNPFTQSHKGSSPHWWDLTDNSHWNWQVAVLYVFCSKSGNLRASLALSDPEEWDWKSGGWTNPHYGGGGKKF
jgi:RHS repeat-associated protein